MARLHSILCRIKRIELKGEGELPLIDHQSRACFLSKDVGLGTGTVGKGDEGRVENGRRHPQCRSELPPLLRLLLKEIPPQISPFTSQWMLGIFLYRTSPLKNHDYRPLQAQTQTKVVMDSIEAAVASVARRTRSRLLSQKNLL